MPNQNKSLEPGNSGPEDPVSTGTPELPHIPSDKEKPKPDHSVPKDADT